METIDSILELKQNLLQIQNTDSLDDLKEAELYEFDIIDAIFQYCLENKYAVGDFPEKYNKLFESEDEDFSDFLDFSVKSFYVYKVSINHHDVFKMIKVYFNDPEADYTDQNCMDDILLSIKILEHEGITLNFDPDAFAESPPFRPKLPR